MLQLLLGRFIIRKSQVCLQFIIYFVFPAQLGMVQRRIVSRKFRSLLLAKKQIEQSFTICCDSFFMLSKIVFFFLQLLNICGNPSVR